MEKIKYEKTDFRKYNNNPKFQYQMLHRMKMDCDYFLGYGERYAGRLWAGNVRDQIKYMRILYELVPEKPQWISLKDIRKYKNSMMRKEGVKYDRKIQNKKRKRL